MAESAEVVKLVPVVGRVVASVQLDTAWASLRNIFKFWINKKLISAMNCALPLLLPILVFGVLTSSVAAAR